MGTAFYRGADCALLVYDITNLESFEGLSNWKNNFLQKSMEKQPQSFPFMAIGNKLDLEEDCRAVHSNDLENWCDSQTDNSIEFFETSAKEDVNVQDAFLGLVKKALKRKEQAEKLIKEKYAREFSLDQRPLKLLEDPSQNEARQG